jgi:ribose-phosphate pyrophosphokinase
MLRELGVRNGFSILAGTANPMLADAIADALGVRLSECVIGRFPDGEVSVRLLESVRRKEVFLVQPTSPPVNDHLVELLALADACRRSAAAGIIGVVPYLGYARADKRHGRREPITGRVAADLLEAVGIDHVITLDLHTPQMEGFFHVPVDSLTAVPALCAAMRDRLPRDTAVVSPDAGRVGLATHYARCLGAPLIVLHKRRDSSTDTEVTHVVGDASGRGCLVVDDMISTGGTVAESIKALLAAGARAEMVVAATHGLLLPGARDKLESPAVRAVFITDSVAVSERGWEKLHVVSIAPVIAEALERVLTDGSIRELYEAPRATQRET